jgi:hypothetical protein
MSNSSGLASLGLRVIICIKFDSRAPADEVVKLKRRLIEDDRSLHSIDVSGSFDFITEVSLPNMPDYQDWVDGFASEFAALVEQYEANFICRRYVRDHSGPIHYLWVTGNGGRTRIDCDEIERFCAEGDYVRAHTANRSWLISSSLARLVEQLDPQEFIRIHRSTVARRDAIVRLRHQRHAWYAIVKSGEALRIAKSHVGEVLQSLRDDWSATHAVSATGEQLSEKPAVLAEE